MAKKFLKKHPHLIDAEFHQLSNELLGSSQLCDLTLLLCAQSDLGIARDHLKSIYTDCERCALDMFFRSKISDFGLLWSFFLHTSTAPNPRFWLVKIGFSILERDWHGRVKPNRLFGIALNYFFAALFGLKSNNWCTRGLPIRSESWLL